MNSHEYCREKSAASGSSFYYSFLFLEPRKRKAINALYAFCRAVDDCVDEASDPQIAHAQLIWWHAELDRIFLNKPTHPIGVALSEAVGQFNLQKHLFEQILRGMKMDLQYQGYQTFDDLRVYCHCVASSPGLIAAQIFGFSDNNTLEYAKKLGIAFQLVNIIRDVGEDARRHRLYLPADELEKFSVQATDIFKTHYSDAFKKLMYFQAERAKQYYADALKILPNIDRYGQRTGLIMGAIYFALLQEIEKMNFTVLDRSIRLTPLRKFWIAWKTARRIKPNDQ